MKETIERLARERVERIIQNVDMAALINRAQSTEELVSFAIAILTDQKVGFKEALMFVSANANLPSVDLNCSCIAHTAKPKLAELAELELSK